MRLSFNVLNRLIFKAGLGLTLGALSVLIQAQSVTAAEKLVFTYGLFGRSITVSELESFANSGPPSSTLKFFLNVSGQDPDKVRSFLKQELPMSPKTMDELLNILPGEFVLFQAGQIFHTPERLANVEALRSAIVLSTVDDRRISLLEFLQKYPTREFYVDGKRLAKTAGDVSGFVSNVEREIKELLGDASGLVEGVLCDCEKTSAQ